MNIKILGDSCCDLTDELRRKMNVKLIPLTIHVDDDSYIDDDTLDTKELLKKMKESTNSPKTACPSPQEYIKEYEGEESVFVVTLSSKLSGSYNSAVLAKNILLEEIKDKFIHVFDSKSASSGEALISMKIFELAKNGYDNNQIVEKVDQYISEMKTLFVLESLDNLIKAGRISTLKGKLASMLSIVPIMKATNDGEIDLFEKVRGSKKAFKRLLDAIGEQGEKLEEKILGITHCNCLEKALEFKEEVMKKYNFKDIIIFETKGISTVYADDGGLIISF
ncbi:putative DegV domain-containing protein [Gottschalkia acidurici 9a]|uniref:DegV domain-containing protein n=1 Tax=Gottschalkia acidurici (strain ATCC 7906 / DSM 604 / BCRC 14475 / CIP 104303 / KCTC 5404 / NCIMB 10678 / 9a) TaxID=1128398 RepID=K0AY56_GOTA9|nr:DegV family protein [Gottschalkia acidurici]AFS77702.1 putative DegV domain-containing protein [Gottschalkia acidurici 9a]